MKINHGKLYIDGEEFDGVLHMPEFEINLTEYIKEPPEFPGFKEMTKGEIKATFEVDQSIFNYLHTPTIYYIINIPVETQVQIIRKAIEKFMGWQND